MELKIFSEIIMGLIFFSNDLTWLQCPVFRIKALGMNFKLKFEKSE